MDGVTPVVTPVSASARLRAEAAALHLSAERDQIEANGTLGHWLRGQQSALGALADLADHIDKVVAQLDERVHDVIKNTRELSISEVHKLKEANALASASIQSAQSAEALLKLEADRTVRGMVESMQPDLIKALKTTTVIRQQQWNLRQNLMGVFSAASLLLGLFGVGYVMGGGDLRSRWDGDFAKAAVARCVEAAGKAGGKPEAFACPMTTLTDTKPEPQPDARKGG